MLAVPASLIAIRIVVASSIGYNLPGRCVGKMLANDPSYLQEQLLAGNRPFRVTCWGRGVL